MTRIIAGFAGSQRLAVPASGTRPTSDRVREAIFSALQSRDAIEGAAVLDLYAGSGALGLEAASRGASQVTLVERNSSAARVAKVNAGIIAKAATEARVAKPRVQVATQAVASFLATSVSTYDIVFIDPPYELGDGELSSALELLVGRVDAASIIVIERSSRSPEPTLPPGLTLDRRKDYGETVLWWLGVSSP